ncbi:MAG: DUF1080 domain-containing protein [Verrucomicrobia bacterium]|nr:DUF1080 domain-containing protein [Verrucomicrobiota bacterium]
MKQGVFLLLTAFLLNAADPVVLFDGKSLEGWKTTGADDCWQVKDGVIVGKSNEKKQGSVLWTKDVFTDFVLEAEFRFSGQIDSGFFLRNESEQIQLGVSRSLKRDMSCSPYIGKKGIYPVEAVGVDALLKTGEWNRIKIAVKGKKYIVTLNGKQVLDYTTDEALEKGPLGLQVHPGVDMEISFRNLTLTAM